MTQKTEKNARIFRANFLALYVPVYVRVCVRVCVRMCVRVRTCACMYARANQEARARHEHKTPSAGATRHCSLHTPGAYAYKLLSA